MQSPRLPNWVLLSQLVRAALPFLVPWLPITGFLAGCQLTLLHLPLPPCPESQPYRPPGTGHLASQKNKITSCEPQPLVYNYDTYWWSYDHVVRHTVIPNPHPTLLSQWDSAQTVSEPVDSHSTSLPDDACKKNSLLPPPTPDLSPSTEIAVGKYRRGRKDPAALLVIIVTDNTIAVNHVQI